MDFTGCGKLLLVKMNEGCCSPEMPEVIFWAISMPQDDYHQYSQASRQIIIIFNQIKYY